MKEETLFRLSIKNKTMATTKIAIVDDHQLVSKAIENMISSNENLEVVLNCNNGESFLKALDASEMHPEVVLMDINMPIKNGVDTTFEIAEKYPGIKVIALTMEDNENTIIQMLKAGAKGYLLKDMSPDLLFSAIDIVAKNGTFYTDIVTQSLLKVKSQESILKTILNDLREPELEFMRLACSELTYKEIANKMCVSPRTIDGYRDAVFLKLNVKSRVGIVLFVLKNKLL